MSFRKFQNLSVGQRIQLLSHHFYEKHLKARVAIIAKQIGAAPNEKQLKALSSCLMGYYFAPFSGDLEYFRQPVPDHSYNRGEEFIMFTKSAYPYVFGVTEKDSPREIVGLAVIIRDYFSRYPLDELDHYLLNGDFVGKTLEQVADDAPFQESGDVYSGDTIKKRISRHFF